MVVRVVWRCQSCLPSLLSPSRVVTKSPSETDSPPWDLTQAAKSWYEQSLYVTMPGLPCMIYLGNILDSPLARWRPCADYVAVLQQPASTLTNALNDSTRKSFLPTRWSKQYVRKPKSYWWRRAMSFTSRLLSQWLETFMASFSIWLRYLRLEGSARIQITYS